MTKLAKMTESAPSEWKQLMRPDFRFGAFNLLILIAIMAIGAALQNRQGEPCCKDIVLMSAISAVGAGLAPAFAVVFDNTRFVRSSATRLPP